MFPTLKLSNPNRFIYIMVIYKNRLLWNRNWCKRSTVIYYESCPLWTYIVVKWERMSEWYDMGDLHRNLNNLVRMNNLMRFVSFIWGYRIFYYLIKSICTKRLFP